LGQVLATNALFVRDWPTLAGGLAATALFGAWLVVRVLRSPTMPSTSAEVGREPAATVGESGLEFVTAKENS
jgi:hypothetical protein